MRKLADDLAEGMSSRPSEAQVEAAVRALSLLADPHRLTLLWLLASDERDVRSLADLIGAAPASTSQHLAKLRLAGLVHVRQDGRRRLYRTAGGHISRLVEEALHYADHRISGQPDHP